MPITVAIVEDNTSVAESLEDAITSAGNCRCVSSSRDGEHALKQLPQHKPDVVIMDIELPGMSGIECTARLKRLLPETQVLILTVYTDTRQIFKALEAGASGYLLKSASPDEIARSILDVKNGGAPMSAEIARKVVQSFRKPAPPQATLHMLSPREIEVLGLLAQAYTSKEIASELGIGYETVCTHLGKIYEKLHVRSRTEAVVKYLHGPEASLPS
jgi:DNA-binding NarL/FixJ family response regulator